MMCSVCGLAGEMVLVRVSGSGAVILHCTACGLAWDGPHFGRVDTLKSLQDLAPKGWEKITLNPTGCYLDDTVDVHLKATDHADRCRSCFAILQTKPA